MTIAARTTNGSSSADAAGVSTNLTIALGSGVVATDAVVLFIVVNNGSASPSTYSAPAGWTQGFGKWAIVGTTLTLYAPDGTTAVRAFTLDSATAPTSRT